MPFALAQELDSSSLAIELRPVDLVDLAWQHQQLALGYLFRLEQAFLVRPFQHLVVVELVVVAA